MTTVKDVPLPWRELLFEAFAEAERKGFGVVSVGFEPASGRHEAAADYLETRLNFLSDRLDRDVT